MHSLSFFILSVGQIDRAHMFKLFQIMETVIVFLGIFMLLRSIEIFAVIQQLDVAGGDFLNPNKYFIDKKYGDMTEIEQNVTVLQRYYFFTLLEMSMFCAYIWAIVIYVTVHTLSPFTVYQFYLLKGFTNRAYNWNSMWSDQKPTE